MMVLLNEFQVFFYCYLFQHKYSRVFMRRLIEEITNKQIDNSSDFIRTNKPNSLVIIVIIIKVLSKKTFGRNWALN